MKKEKLPATTMKFDTKSKAEQKEIKRSSPKD